MKASTLLLTSLFSVVSFAAFAQDGAGLEKRSENQEKRLEQGKESGALTEKEANRLARREQALDKRIDHAQADGTVTKAEKARITRAQNKQSRKIARKKNN